MDPPTRYVPTTAVMDRRVDFAIGTVVALLGVAIVLVGEATIRPGLGGDVLGPRAFPRLVGAGLFVGGVAIALTALLAWRSGDVRDDLGGAGDEPGHPASSPRAFGVMGLTLAYTLLMGPVGYPIATAAYFALLLRLLQVRSVAIYVGLCLGFSLAVYMIFAYVLKVPLSSGVLHPVMQALGLER